VAENPANHQNDSDWEMKRWQAPSGACYLLCLRISQSCLLVKLIVCPLDFEDVQFGLTEGAYGGIASQSGQKDSLERTWKLVFGTY
jgi:hypothetical protein